MRRSMVGLLAAVGTVMSVLAALAHNDIALVIIAAIAGAASGSAASLPLPLKKKSELGLRAGHLEWPTTAAELRITVVPATTAEIRSVRRAHFGPGLWPGPRRQACWVGRGSSVKGGLSPALDAGGADPDMRRSGTRACDTLRLLAHSA